MNQYNHAERLAFQFFRDFSRLEYSLKFIGFVKSDNQGAKVDWGKFLKKYAELSVEQRDEFKYFIDNKPCKQVLQDGKLIWVEIQRTDQHTDFGFVVNCIKTIRNNLFHGGKLSISGLFNDDERAIRQLQNGINFINYINEQCQLHAVFYEPSC